jgi:hypothetical protein
MKIINIIFKILASVCMIVFISIMGVLMLWVLFDPSREWMVVMPVWLRLAYLLLILGISSFAIYVDCVKSKKYDNQM